MTAAARTCRVVAVDIGSVLHNFAWAALDLPERVTVDDGSDPEGAAQAVARALEEKRPVALGFEAPLTVPVPQDWAELGRGRTGDGNRPWSAGAGSGVLATGLVQTAWVLRRVVRLRGTALATTQPDRWLAGAADLLLWEAFVSGPGKPAPGQVSQHAADAAIATETFADRLAQGTLAAGDVTCEPHSAFSLAWAAAMVAGATIEPDERAMLAPVYRTRPVAGLPQ